MERKVLQQAGKKASDEQVEKRIVSGEEEEGVCMVWIGDEKQSRKTKKLGKKAAHQWGRKCVLHDGYRESLKKLKATETSTFKY